MTNFALIENGTVANLVVVPDDQAHRGVEYMANDLGLGGLWVEAGDAGIGWLYENGKLVPPVDPGPEPVIPHSVTRRQGRLALLEVGKLDQVEAAVEVAGMAAQIEYEADTWERSNAFLQTMWAQLGGTESELDALFVLASEK